MASATGVEPRPAPLPSRAFSGGALVGALLVEAALISGILLPLRLDQHPPSLAINLAVRLGSDARGLLLYLLLIVALAGGSVIALPSVRRAGRRALLPVVAAAALFSLTVLAAHPAYSSDVFHYVATARVAFTHGENPHTVPPEAIPDDPAMVRSGWKWVPSPYGPAWSWLSAIPWALSGGAGDATRALLAFKALTTLCLLGATVGVALAAERLRPGSGATAALLFGWNPVVLVHLAGDGHNDAAMLLAIAWGAVALTRGKAGAALALFGVAVLVKPAAVFAFVILAGGLLRGRCWRDLAVGVGITAGVAVVLWWPFWDGLHTFRAMLDEGRYFTSTPASLAQRALEPLLGGDPARVVVGGALRLALAALILTAIVRTPSRPGAILLATGEIYLLAVVVLGTWYQPWYATWPLLFLAIVAAGQPRTLALVAALTAGALLVPVVFNFVTALSGREARDATIELLATALVVLPVAAAGWRWTPQFVRGPSQIGAVSSTPTHPPRSGKT